MLGDAPEGALDPVDSDVDFYTFEGMAGQWARFVVAAKPDATPLAPAYADSVLTLYDANQTQIAFNDDVFPRFSQNSFIQTRLPQDGTYYLKVQEYCATTEGQSICPNGWQDMITEPSYTLGTVELDPTEDGLVLESEPNDTPAQAGALEFPPGPNGAYDQLAFFFGMLEPANVDVYSFVVPPASDFQGLEPTVWIAYYFAGVDGNGSTSPIGTAWIVHEATQAIIARIEQPAIGQSLMPRVTPGETYNVYVDPPAGALGDNPFYFMFNANVLSGLPEQDDVGNDVTPEALPESMIEGIAPGTHGWMVAADIGTVSDVDQFELTLPSTMPADPMVQLECFAERRGSGLRGLAAELSRGSNAEVLITGTETATSPIWQFDVPVPAGETTLHLRISAPAIDAVNPATFYRCWTFIYGAP
jgi:hypothetical protein